MKHDAKWIFSDLKTQKEIRYEIYTVCVCVYVCIYIYIYISDCLAVMIQVFNWDWNYWKEKQWAGSHAVGIDWGLVIMQVLISVQHPIVYRSGSEKLVMVGVVMFRSSCPDSMEQNRLLVRLTSPLYTHIPRRFSRRCFPLRSLTVQAPRFLVLQWGESAAAERGGAYRDYRAMQAQSYLYSVYRFTLTHHGAGSIKIAAAYHWKKKKSCLYFLSVISTNKKQINHLHMTTGCETETLVFAYWLHTLLKFVLVPFFFKSAHTKCQSDVSVASYLFSIFL